MSVRKSPTDWNCQEPSPALRNCHQLSGIVTNCQDDGPPVLFIGDQCGRSLKQTPAKSSLPIGALLRVTSNHQSRDCPFLTRARRNPQSTQAQSTTPCLGRWTSTKGRPFAGIAERKCGALTRRQRRPWSCRTGCRASIEKGGCQRR